MINDCVLFQTSKQSGLLKFIVNQLQVKRSVY